MRSSVPRFCVVSAVVGVVGVCGVGCPAEDLVCSPVDEAGVERLAGYVDVDCDVQIVGTELVTLDALQDLRSAKSVQVIGNAVLDDVSRGLSGLQEVGFVSVQRNPRVRELVLDNPLQNVGVSGNDLGVVDVVVTDGGSFSADNEPLATLNVHGTGNKATGHLGLSEATQLSTLSGVDVDSVFVFEIRNAPVLVQSDVDAFVAGLDAAPAAVTVCGVVDGTPCP